MGGEQFGDETGCCAGAVNDLIRLQPDDRQAAALKLYKTLAALSEDRLAFLKAMDDQVCEHTECADMDPQFVRRLVSLASDKQQADRSNRIAWFGLAVATLSTMIALASLLLSVISHRRSRRPVAARGEANLRNVKRRD